MDDMPGVGEPIAIRGGVLDAMIEHARADAPLECCGLLVGAGRVIDESIRTRNLRASATQFLIDPAEHLAAIRRTRHEGRAIVGAYHSHPRSAATPSPTDLHEAHYTEFLYLIISLADPGAPDVRAYRLGDGNFVPSPLVPVP